MGKMKGDNYKFFSTEPLSDQHISDIFEKTKEVYRHEFYAYPFLKVNPEFPRIILEKDVYYVNAFELSLSCMEGELVAGRNIARLINKNLNSKQTQKQPREEL